MSHEVNVVVWSKQGCSYCDEVKGYLREKAVAYETIDVTERDEMRDVLQAKYGIRHVPSLKSAAVTAVCIRPLLKSALNM